MQNYPVGNELILSVSLVVCLAADITLLAIISIIPWCYNGGRVLSYYLSG